MQTNKNSQKNFPACCALPIFELPQIVSLSIVDVRFCLVRGSVCVNVETRLYV